MSTKNYYQSCSVPYCRSTTIKTPEKLFIHVPAKENMRKKWLKVARLDVEDVSPRSKLFFCEDHFDLPKDMVNYMRYHLMGSVSRIQMKRTCVPSRFECQSDRKNQLKELVEHLFRDGSSLDAGNKRRIPAASAGKKNISNVCDDDEETDTATECEGENDNNERKGDSQVPNVVQHPLSGKRARKILRKPMPVPIKIEPLDTEASMYENDVHTGLGDKPTGYRCKECGVNIVGFRYACVQCEDWDICNACQVRGAHCAHYMLRVPRCKSPEEAKAVLIAIRNVVMNNDYRHTILQRIKTETKSDESDFEEPDFLDFRNTNSQCVFTEHNYRRTTIPRKRPRLSNSQYFHHEKIIKALAETISTDVNRQTLTSDVPTQTQLQLHDLPEIHSHDQLTNICEQQTIMPANDRHRIDDSEVFGSPAQNNTKPIYIYAGTSSSLSHYVKETLPQSVGNNAPIAFINNNPTTIPAKDTTSHTQQHNSAILPKPFITIEEFLQRNPSYIQKNKITSESVKKGALPAVVITMKCPGQKTYVKKIVPTKTPTIQPGNAHETEKVLSYSSPVRNDNDHPSVPANTNSTPKVGDKEFVQNEDKATQTLNQDSKNDSILQEPQADTNEKEKTTLDDKKTSLPAVFQVISEHKSAGTVARNNLSVSCHGKTLTSTKVVSLNLPSASSDKHLKNYVIPVRGSTKAIDKKSKSKFSRRNLKYIENESINLNDDQLTIPANKNHGLSHKKVKIISQTVIHDSRFKKYLHKNRNNIVDRDHKTRTTKFDCEKVSQTIIKHKVNKTFTQNITYDVPAESISKKPRNTKLRNRKIKLAEEKRKRAEKKIRMRLRQYEENVKKWVQDSNKKLIACQQHPINEQSVNYIVQSSYEDPTVLEITPIKIVPSIPPLETSAINHDETQITNHDHQTTMLADGHVTSSDNEKITKTYSQTAQDTQGNPEQKAPISVPVYSGDHAAGLYSNEEKSHTRHIRTDGFVAETVALDNESLSASANILYSESVKSGIQITPIGENIPIIPYENSIEDNHEIIKRTSNDNGATPNDKLDLRTILCNPTGHISDDQKTIVDYGHQTATPASDNITATFDAERINEAFTQTMTYDDTTEGLIHNNQTIPTNTTILNQAQVTGLTLMITVQNTVYTADNDKHIATQGDAFAALNQTGSLDNPVESIAFNNVTTLVRDDIAKTFDHSDQTTVYDYDQQGIRVHDSNIANNNLGAQMINIDDPTKYTHYSGTIVGPGYETTHANVNYAAPLAYNGQSTNAHGYQYIAPSGYNSASTLNSEIIVGALGLTLTHHNPTEILSNNNVISTNLYGCQTTVPPSNYFTPRFAHVEAIGLPHTLNYDYPAIAQSQSNEMMPVTHNYQMPMPSDSYHTTTFNNEQCIEGPSAIVAHENPTETQAYGNEVTAIAFNNRMVIPMEGYYGSPIVDQVERAERQVETLNFSNPTDSFSHSNDITTNNYDYQVPSPRSGCSSPFDQSDNMEEIGPLTQEKPTSILTQSNELPTISNDYQKELQMTTSSGYSIIDYAKEKEEPGSAPHNNKLEESATLLCNNNLTTISDDRQMLVNDKNALALDTEAHNNGLSRITNDDISRNIPVHNHQRTVIANDHETVTATKDLSHSERSKSKFIEKLQMGVRNLAKKYAENSTKTKFFNDSSTTMENNSNDTVASCNDNPTNDAKLSEVDSRTSTFTPDNSTKSKTDTCKILNYEGSADQLSNNKESTATLDSQNQTTVTPDLQSTNSENDEQKTKAIIRKVSNNFAEKFRIGIRSYAKMYAQQKSAREMLKLKNQTEENSKKDGHDNPKSETHTHESSTTTNHNQQTKVLADDNSSTILDHTQNVNVLTTLTQEIPTDVPQKAADIVHAGTLSKDKEIREQNLRKANILPKNDERLYPETNFKTPIKILPKPCKKDRHDNRKSETPAHESPTTNQTKVLANDNSFTILNHIQNVSLLTIPADIPQKAADIASMPPKNDKRLYPETNFKTPIKILPKPCKKDGHDNPKTETSAHESPTTNHKQQTKVLADDNSTTILDHTQNVSVLTTLAQEIPTDVPQKAADIIHTGTLSKGKQIRKQNTRRANVPPKNYKRSSPNTNFKKPIKILPKPSIPKIYTQSKILTGVHNYRKTRRAKIPAKDIIVTSIDYKKVNIPLELPNITQPEKLIPVYYNDDTKLGNKQESRKDKLPSEILTRKNEPQTGLPVAEIIKILGETMDFQKLSATSAIHIRKVAENNGSLEKPEVSAVRASVSQTKNDENHIIALEPNETNTPIRSSENVPTLAPKAVTTSVPQTENSDNTIMTLSDCESPKASLRSELNETNAPVRSSRKVSTLAPQVVTTSVPQIEDNDNNIITSSNCESVDEALQSEGNKTNIPVRAANTGVSETEHNENSITTLSVCESAYASLQTELDKTNATVRSSEKVHTLPPEAVNTSVPQTEDNDNNVMTLSDCESPETSLRNELNKTNAPVRSSRKVRTLSPQVVTTSVPQKEDNDYNIMILSDCKIVDESLQNQLNKINIPVGSSRKVQTLAPRAVNTSVSYTEDNDNGITTFSDCESAYASLQTELDKTNTPVRSSKKVRTLPPIAVNTRIPQTEDNDNIASLSDCESAYASLQSELRKTIAPVRSSRKVRTLLPKAVNTGVPQTEDSDDIMTLSDCESVDAFLQSELNKTKTPIRSRKVRTLVPKAVNRDMSQTEDSDNNITTLNDAKNVKMPFQIKPNNTNTSVRSFRKRRRSAANADNDDTNTTTPNNGDSVETPVQTEPVKTSSRGRPKKLRTLSTKATPISLLPTEYNDNTATPSHGDSLESPVQKEPVKTSSRGRPRKSRTLSTKATPTRLLQTENNESNTATPSNDDSLETPVQTEPIETNLRVRLKNLRMTITKVVPTSLSQNENSDSNTATPSNGDSVETPVRTGPVKANPRGRPRKLRTSTTKATLSFSQTGHNDSNTTTPSNSDSLETFLQTEPVKTNPRGRPRKSRTLATKAANMSLSQTENNDSGTTSPSNCDSLEIPEQTEPIETYPHVTRKKLRTSATKAASMSLSPTDNNYSNTATPGDDDNLETPVRTEPIEKNLRVRFENLRMTITKAAPKTLSQSSPTENNDSKMTIPSKSDTQDTLQQAEHVKTNPRGRPRKLRTSATKTANTSSAHTENYESNTTPSIDDRLEIPVQIEPIETSPRVTRKKLRMSATKAAPTSFLQNENNDINTTTHSNDESIFESIDVNTVISIENNPIEISGASVVASAHSNLTTTVANDEKTTLNESFTSALDHELISLAYTVQNATTMQGFSRDNSPEPLSENSPASNIEDSAKSALGKEIEIIFKKSADSLVLDETKTPEETVNINTDKNRGRKRKSDGKDSDASK